MWWRAGDVHPEIILVVTDYDVSCLFLSVQLVVDGGVISVALPFQSSREGS